jgi:hypothetical protein
MFKLLWAIVLLLSAAGSGLAQDIIPDIAPASPAEGSAPQTGAEESGPPLNLGELLPSSEDPPPEPRRMYTITDRPPQAPARRPTRARTDIARPDEQAPVQTRRRTETVPAPEQTRGRADTARPEAQTRAQTRAETEPAQPQIFSFSPAPPETSAPPQQTQEQTREQERGETVPPSEQEQAPVQTQVQEEATQPPEQAPEALEREASPANPEQETAPGDQADQASAPPVIDLPAALAAGDLSFLDGFWLYSIYECGYESDDIYDKLGTGDYSFDRQGQGRRTIHMSDSNPHLATVRDYYQAYQGTVRAYADQQGRLIIQTEQADNTVGGSFQCAERIVITAIEYDSLVPRYIMSGTRTVSGDCACGLGNTSPVTMYGYRRIVPKNCTTC